MKRHFSYCLIILLVLTYGCTSIPQNNNSIKSFDQTPDLSSLIASGSKVDNELERVIMETLWEPNENKPAWFDNALQSLTIDVTNGVVNFTHNDWLVFNSMDDLGNFAYFIIYAAAKSPELYYIENEEYTELSKVQVVFPNDIGDIIMTLSGRTNIHAVADDYSRLDDLIEITKGAPSP